MDRRVAGRVAVIGAGYAGLACAVELADAGVAIDIFDTSRTLGGRARAVPCGAWTLDNGAHILVGAYRETLRLIDKVGASGTALRRLPLRLEFPSRFRLAAAPLPAPLHLAWGLWRAKGLDMADISAAIRFMRAQRLNDFRLPVDLSAADLLAAHRQPERVRRFLWEPLCLAALNTPVAAASAQVFLNVLRDSLAADRAASDLLLPTTDLSTLFPEPAVRFVAARGGRILRGHRITTIARRGDNWWADGHGPYAHLILAVAPYHLPALIAPHAELAALHRTVTALAYQPIATVYLAYPHTVGLPRPMLGLIGGHAQWLFDRGQLGGPAGLLAAVISGTGAWQTLGHTILATSVHNEIAALLPGLPAPRESWVIEEKRATFSCTPGLVRPPRKTAAPGLWLAGDYVAGPYPATLEAAVQSGIAAAHSILHETTGSQA